MKAVITANLFFQLQGDTEWIAKSFVHLLKKGDLIIRGLTLHLSLSWIKVHTLFTLITEYLINSEAQHPVQIWMTEERVLYRLPLGD